MCILSQLKESAIRPNRSCANLALSFGPGDLLFGRCYNRCSCIENGIKTELKRCNCSRSKSHFIRYCCVLLKTVTRSFVYTIGFFHNGGMLTSSGQLNLEALTHDASNSSWWYSLLKFGRCKIATLKKHAIFFLEFFHFSASLANVPRE